MGKKPFWWLDLCHTVHQQLAWEPRCGCVWLSVLPGWGCDNRGLSAGLSATPLSAHSQASESVGVAEGAKGPDSSPGPSSPVWGAGHLENNSWIGDMALFYSSLGKLILAWDDFSWCPVSSHVTGHGQPFPLHLDTVTCGQNCYVAQLQGKQIS